MIYESNIASQGWDECRYHIGFLHVMFCLHPGRLSLGNSLIKAPVGLSPGCGELSSTGRDQTLHLPSHLLRLTPRLAAPVHHGLALLLPGLRGALGGDILTLQNSWSLPYKLLETRLTISMLGWGDILVERVLSPAQ